MAQGLISNFERWKPGESQGLIDPSWPGGPRGGGYDPNAVWPLAASAGVMGGYRLGRVAGPPVARFLKKGAGEIIDAAEGVVNLGRTLVRKFPYGTRVLSDVLKGKALEDQLKKVTEQEKDKEYPLDVGIEEDDEDIDIPEDEELLDKQLRAKGYDPDSTVDKALEKIELRNKESDKILEERNKELEAIRESENVISLEDRRARDSTEYQSIQRVVRDGANQLSLIRDKIDKDIALDDSDQKVLNYILFNQSELDADLDLRAWTKEDIKDRLESSWLSTIDRLFESLDDEEIEFLKEEMNIIIDHVSTQLKRNPDVDYGGEVVEFPIDAGASEPSDEVLFGPSEVLTFPDHPDLPRTVVELKHFNVSVIRLPDGKYRVKALDVRSSEIKELPSEIAELFTSKLNSKDIERAIKLLDAFFSWED